MKNNLQDTSRKETLKMHGNQGWLTLRWISDILTGCQIPHFLLGETSNQALADVELNVDKIEIGVLKKDFNETTIRLFNTFLPGLEQGDVIKLEKDGIPIEIKIIQRHYKFFDNPDIVFYMADEYKIPNPYSKYWQSRYLIK